jgi:AAA15 family ATPase/GTPase
MLLRFSVANHRSIYSPQEISLVASSLKDPDEGLIACDISPTSYLVPAAILYGANASGKSNLISALKYMRAAVLLSHSQGTPGEPPPRQPFALDQTASETPSSFDIEFMVGGVRFNYGFSVGPQSFDDEWLFSYPTRRKQLLFKRSGVREIEFGRGLKGRNKTIAELTRPNSLFLSAALQNGHEELTRIAGFFQEMILSDHVSVPGSTISSRFQSAEVDEKVINFLKGIGTGITGFRRKTEELTDTLVKFNQELESLFIKMFPDSNLNAPPGNERTRTTIELSHLDVRGEDVFFDPDDESAGTRRLLLVLSSVFRAISQGSLMVIDELDASLHTQACEAIIALFSTKSTNPKGAQLIATTHDTNLMLSKFLRRDQVWFSEKDTTGATVIFGLSDIVTRRGDNLERGYLQGRFGATPLTSTIHSLLSRL